MKQSTKECLIVFLLSLLLVVGSATGGYVGCTLACRDCCPAAKPDGRCPPKPAASHPDKKSESPECSCRYCLTKCCTCCRANPWQACGCDGCECCLACKGHKNPAPMPPAK